MGVKDILKASVERTKELLTRELNIRLGELKGVAFLLAEKVFL